jgi:DNA polymerase-3 subunit delta'
VATNNVIITIEEVRGLIAVAARKPSQGQWRVIIVEDADRMVERTSNVLLKAIEEPPDHTVWVLSAPSPRDVIVTVRSRCRPVSLRIPPVEGVTRLLVDQDGIDEDAARSAAMAAQCHIGMARRLATDPSARERRDLVLGIPRAASSVGGAVIAAGEVVDMAKAEAESRSKEREEQAAAATRRAHGLGEEGAAAVPARLRSHLGPLKADRDEVKRRTTRWQRDVLDRAMVDLLAFYRDVLSVQQGSGIDLINASHADEVARVAGTTSIAATLRSVDVIAEARLRLSGNVAPALALEGMAVGIALAASCGAVQPSA